MSKFVRVALVALLSVCVVGFMASSAGAQGGSGLQVSPTRHELSAEPGEAKSVVFTVKNVTQGDLIVRVVVNDFEADNNTGQPVIIVDEGQQSARSLKSFVEDVPDIELASGEAKEVEITLDVPLNASPGGHYGAIRFVAIPKGADEATADRQVALTASIGGLVLVEVTGEITQGMQLERVGVERGGRLGSFFFGSPDKTAVSVRNTGNSFIKPFGKVTITKGGNEVASYEINDTEPQGNVLPDSSRTFRNDIEAVGGFGKYNVTASVSYTQGGEVLTLSKTFWIIPWWMVAIALILVVALVAAIIYVRKRRGPRRVTPTRR